MTIRRHDYAAVAAATDSAAATATAAAADDGDDGITYVNEWSNLLPVDHSPEN